MHRSIIVLSLISSIFIGQIFAIVIRVPQDYPTIQQGIDAAGRDDIVLVAPGTYPEEITMKADVVIMGAGEGLSIIDGGGDAGDVVRAIGNDITNTAKLQGFTIRGAISGGSMPGGAGIFCNSGAQPEICNNRVEGNDQGIVTWNQSSAFIHNNVVIDNNYNGISLSSKASVINNTIANNGRSGIYDSGGYRPPIMNNIITGNTTYGIGCVNSGVPTDFSYNDVWGNGQNYYNCSPGPGDISLDPLYEDEPNGDYHLQIGSPCIDAGNPLPQYNDPDGTRNDMGAYGGPGATADFPLVLLTIPSQNEINIAGDIDVSAMFNINMDRTTFTSSTCILSGHQTGSVSATITYDSTARMVTIDPDQNFRVGEILTAVLTKNILSDQGDSLGGFIWQFVSRIDSGSAIFSSTTNYDTDDGPHYVLVADFDSDGDFDLAAANVNSNSVSIHLGNGDGTFNPASNYGVGTNPYSVCTYDFNADGNLDLVSANSGSNNVSILLGNGDGTFGSANNYSAGTQPRALCCGDFNADGAFDLAVANEGSNNVSILLGNGDGSFSSQDNYVVGSSPYSVCSGDFDNDGDIDLATANEGSNNVSVLLGDGNGNLGSATNYNVGTNPYSLCAVDFDGDGALDLAVANNGSNSVSRLLGNGDGTFGTRVNYSAGNSPYSISASDFDGDGRYDLAVANASSSNISILIGNGDGTFDPAINYPTGNSPRAITSGDFDNDNDIDLVTAHYMSDSLYVLFNEGALCVSSTDPAQNQLDVSKSTDVAATFNMAVDSTTINDTTVLVAGIQSGPHAGTITYSGGTYTVTLDPADDFIDGELVSVILTKDIQSLIGAHLRGFSWDFNTEVTTTSNGTFSNAQNFFAGIEPRGEFAGDFDSDGDIDLAVTLNIGVVAILMNNGDGTFSNPTNYTISTEPIAIYGADFHGNEYIDLAVVNNRPGNANLDILRNAGDGTFTRTQTYTLSIMGNSLFAADLDGDGDNDIVLSSYWGNNNNVDIMLNNGNGTFSGPYVYSAGTWAHGVIAKDFDNDGDIDLAVASSGDDNISILLNDGDADFSDLANYLVGDYPYHVYANDFNDDGFADIATANYGGDNITVILNNGDGTFAGPAGYAPGNNTRAIIGGDFDGDGDIDLTASNNGTDSVSVILNNGDGTFDNHSTYQVGSNPWSIQTADFDLDGDLDIASANYNSDNVTILFNTGSAIAENQQIDITPFLRVFPNPFRSRLNMTFNIGHSSNDLEVNIYDVSGRLVRQLSYFTRDQSSNYLIVWDCTDDLHRKVSSGVYFCQVKTPELTLTKEIILIR